MNHTVRSGLLLLVAFLAAFSLAGCGNDKSEETKQPELNGAGGETKEPEETVPKLLGNVQGTLTFGVASEPAAIMNSYDGSRIFRESVKAAIAETVGISEHLVMLLRMSAVDVSLFENSTEEEEAADEGRGLASTGHLLQVPYELELADEPIATTAITTLKEASSTSLSTKINHFVSAKVAELPADNEADLMTSVGSLTVVDVPAISATYFSAESVAAFAAAEQGATFVAPTCVAEQTLRRWLQSKVTSANVLRGVFHDAVDKDNLMIRNITSSGWIHVHGSYGGVDGCLYSPLTEGTHGTPNPSHNRNIKNGFDWAREICDKVCRNAWPAGLANTSLCSNKEDCEVDITVLGSLVAIENAGGPPIDMSWGRKRGNCEEDNIVTKFTKNSAAKKDYDKYPALREAPSLTGIDDATQFREAFEAFGFSATDQVALMGAHTFGQLQVCAGGLNGIERGSFCTNATKVDMLMANGTSWLAPEDKFGDGGLWDRTPMTFDNDYFKLFENEAYESKDDCCGHIKEGRCHRSGKSVRITMRDDDMKANATELIEDGACGVSWCRSDRKNRTHMKSTKAWTTVNASWEGFGKSGKHGVQKRMIRLAGDWALLGTPETKAKVQHFARDETAFFEAFKTAWVKVISKTDLTLSPCLGEVIAGDVDTSFETLTCQDRHPKCPNGRCHNSKWARLCPRECGGCPDQR